MTRQRLDLAIEARGLLPSRARARDAILRGTVSVNGVPVTRPGRQVGPEDQIALADPAAGYVSRAALKLIAGLDAGGIDVAGKICLDVGASTGGFSQVLLERGASRVYAVDVGHGQLHETLRDPRLVSLERTDARSLSRELVPEEIDFLCCDVSFVSARKVLAAPLALCRPGAQAAILVKPQFETGPEAIGKGGIVSDPAVIDQAVADVTSFMAGLGWSLISSVPSPIAGGEGNREMVAVFART